MDLKNKNCNETTKNSVPFTGEQIIEFMKQIKPDWKVVDDIALKKEIPFDDFNLGMDFAHKVADLANEQNHHPDLCIHYSHVDVELSTHDIGGLSLNDFIMAAKIDELLK